MHYKAMIIDKNAVKQSFSKAAKSYDQYALFQRDTGDFLLQLAKLHSNSCKNILDLGCGTGYFSKQLNDWQQSHYYQLSADALTCFDLSPFMLQETDKRGLTYHQSVEGDIDKLPFVNDSFDLIFSNLVLQWSEDLSEALSQAKQTLKKSGVICFSTLLDGSLTELKSAWQAVDNNQHINTFLNESEIKSAVECAGFREFKIFTKTYSYFFPDVIAVMKSLKGIGANHVHHGQQSNTLGKKGLQQLSEAYKPFSNKQGLRLSYQVCYVVAINN